MECSALGAMLVLWCLALALHAEEPFPATAADQDFKSEISNPESENSTPEPYVAESNTPKLGINKLDKKSRAKALAALAGLVILGLGMVSLAWLGARVTRRYMNPAPFDHQRLTSSAPAANDWAKKPLVDNSDFEKTDE